MISKLDDLKKVNFPECEQIPSEGIYKEELLMYIIKILEPLFVDDENFLTSSIVNNYVKLSYIDKPIKKRYYRESIAQLIVIIIFKQIITIEEISKGIEIEISTFGVKEVYENFVKIFHKVRDSIVEKPNDNPIAIDFKVEDHHEKVLYYLSISLFSKLYTKIIIGNR